MHRVQARENGAVARVQTFPAGRRGGSEDLRRQFAGRIISSRHTLGPARIENRISYARIISSVALGMFEVFYRSL